MIELVVGGVVGGLVTYYIRVKEETLEEHHKHVVYLGEYLTNIASCLREIKTELRRGRVPREAGKQLTRVMEGFSKNIEDLYIKDWELRKEIEDAQDAIKQLFTMGEFREEMIRGLILNAAKKERKEKLDDLERAAAKIEERGYHLIENPDSAC